MEPCFLLLICNLGLIPALPGRISGRLNKTIWECWAGRLHYDAPGSGISLSALHRLSECFLLLLLLLSSSHMKTSTSLFPKVSFTQRRGGIIAKRLQGATGVDFSRSILKAEKAWSQWMAKVPNMLTSFGWLPDKLPNIFIGKMSLLPAWQNLCKLTSDLSYSQGAHQCVVGEGEGGHCKCIPHCDFPSAQRTKEIWIDNIDPGVPPFFKHLVATGSIGNSSPDNSNVQLGSRTISLRKN